MHAHQLAALKRELDKPQYAGKSVDEKLAAVNEPEVIRRLTRTTFYTKEQWDALRQKDRDRAIEPLVVSDLSGFDGGVPGFPNKVRREDIAALGG